MAIPSYESDAKDPTSDGANEKDVGIYVQEVAPEFGERKDLRFV